MKKGSFTKRQRFRAEDHTLVNRKCVIGYQREGFTVLSKAVRPGSPGCLVKTRKGEASNLSSMEDHCEKMLFIN